MDLTKEKLVRIIFRFKYKVMAELLELPIGEQSFAKLRRENRLYVDKTKYVYKMAHRGTYYFLSRPRRFGKSLLLSTMEAYFLGKREMFEDLYIGKVETDWSVYPVMHLDFNTQNYTCEDDLYQMLDDFLREQENKYGSPALKTSVALRFKQVIRSAYEKMGKGVVILVDEYDKPLLQSINNPKLRDNYHSELRGFYSVLKTMDEYIQFAFLTGLTKFSKLSIFSDLNNLNDISRDRDYAYICGLTDEELDENLNPHINNFAERRGVSYEKARRDLQRMYDGYHFVSNSTGLYNPFSIMCALSKGELGSYWFETGTPTVLVEKLQRQKYNLDMLDRGNSWRSGIG